MSMKPSPSSTKTFSATSWMRSHCSPVRERTRAPSLRTVTKMSPGSMWFSLT